MEYLISRGELEFYDVSLSKEEWEKAQAIIASRRDIVEVSFCYCDVEGGIEDFLISAPEIVSSLQFDEYHFNQREFQALICSLTGLKSLTMMECGPVEITRLINSLIRNKTLTNFEFSCGGLSSEEIKALSRLLLVNKTLKSLYLRNLFLGNDDLRVLLSGIEDNTTLEVLDLSGNRTKDFEVFEVLKNRSNLKRLDLAGNPVEKNFDRLLEFIKYDDSLTEIIIDYTETVHQAIPKVIACLKNNRRLLKFHLLDHFCNGLSSSLSSNQKKINRVLAMKSEREINFLNFRAKSESLQNKCARLIKQEKLNCSVIPRVIRESLLLS